MRLAYKRNRKFRRLKFKCQRCGCKFITHLYPDCTFEYQEIMDGAHDDLPNRFIKCFVKIRTKCPDCGDIVEYPKRIDLEIDDKKV